VATAAETVLAAARDLDVLDLVPLADSALHLRHCTVEELAGAARQHRRGAPRLRKVLPLLDGRSESAWESVLRLLHHVAEVEVEPQLRIEDVTGRFVARADLWVVGTRRLHEYDGEVHRERATHRADLARDRGLVENGWQRLGWTAPEVLLGGPVIASLDALLDRPWRSVRLARWRSWVAASSWRTNR
jgi:very-short-patch-repair endonuclease